MKDDPTLAALIAGGHYVIAADRYEEETGDVELAALMRINGLEWELVDGVPGLRLAADLVDVDDGRFIWWHLRCGAFDFGTVYYDPFSSIPVPQVLAESPIPSMLKSAGLGSRCAERFHMAYKKAVCRVCA